MKLRRRIYPLSSRVLCGAIAATIVGGCASTGSEAGDGSVAAIGSGSGPQPEQSLPLEAALPERFGLGRRASDGEIAAWDIDVMPDGRGLPEGEGDVATGREIYAARCQHCHGEDGRGGPFDRLAGRITDDAFPFATDPAAPRTIGSYWPYATTLFDYTRRAMPLERPGSLDDAEVYSLTAYLLHLNGLVAADAILDRENLPGVSMPSRDRFVPDDRRGGEEIR